MALADLPLLQEANIHYAGAYRVPANDVNAITAAFSGSRGALAYRAPRSGAPNGSLYMVGGVEAGVIWPISEIALPSSAPVNSAVPGDMAPCTWMQNPVNLTQYLTPPTINPIGWHPGEWNIGGLAVEPASNKLMMCCWHYYSGENSYPSHSLQPLDLSSINSGTVQQQQRRLTATYSYSGGNVPIDGGGFGIHMGEVPTAWRAELGNLPWMTGASGISIINRTSTGPVAWGFDPASLNTTTATPATQYLYYYPFDLPIIPGPLIANNPADTVAKQWVWESPPNNALNMADGDVFPIFNSSGHTTGCLPIPGTRTIIFTGSAGDGYSYYGDYNKNYDVNTQIETVFTNGTQDDMIQGGKGNHSVALPAGFKKQSPANTWDSVGSAGNSGVYSRRMWAYDALEFKAVFNGSKTSKQVLPYSWWRANTPKMSGIGTTGWNKVGGATLDAANRRFFVTGLQDDVVGFRYNPLIHVYTYDDPATLGLGADRRPAIVRI